MAGIDARYCDESLRERAWDDAPTYCCALLRGICLGARVGEVAGLSAMAVDLEYAPPLVALLGKGNRFVEVSRTLMVPSRLLPLWRVVMGNRHDGAAFLLHRQRSDGQRAMKRADFWHHVAALSAHAGLHGDVSGCDSLGLGYRKNLIGARLACQLRRRCR